MSLKEIADFCQELGVTMKSGPSGIQFYREYTMSRRTYSNNRIVDSDASLNTMKAAIREVARKSDDELRYGDKRSDN